MTIHAYRRTSKTHEFLPHSFIRKNTLRELFSLRQHICNK
jgi:hypothetical protein